jgi:hypothetical protein
VVGARGRSALGGIAIALMVSVPSVAADDALPPVQWPSSTALSAKLEGWPNAVRYSGNDRYQTSLAVELGLRGTGDYPFDTPDRSSGGASVLATAHDWWGAGVCPRAIIVVTGDNPADSLGASALSDPTHQSTEPWLERTAAADPVFYPVGGFARVDTDSAPILITASARSGAVSLSPATRLAANDLRRGGCTTARQAIVVGGTSAVPAGVDAELLSLGYREVFRIAGSNRYDTAARIAQSLGTAPPPGGELTCADPDTTDGTARQKFYANAVVELRDSPTSCRLLSRTVVLADGVTGADALAAGWWTSFWQVPVLLHDGSGSLPQATVNALLTMPVSNVIVLGGTSRISAAVATEAKNLAGATELVRIAGTDRYDTSVQMAQRLGGWWPTGDAADFDGSMVCLAASAPSAQSGGSGWPDALGAGPFCGALSGAAANPGPPSRALPSPSGVAPSLSPSEDLRPAHDAVPILLVPTGAHTLPTSVNDLLAGVFPASGGWCNSTLPILPCSWPGFIVAFGGEAALPSSLIADASLVVGGGSGQLGSVSPSENTKPFLTRLDMAPVFDEEGSGTTLVCAARGSYADARWLAVYDDGVGGQAIGSIDIMMRRRYLLDPDGIGRTPFTGAPACARLTAPTPVATARFVGVSGRVTALHAYGTTAADRFSLAAPLIATTPASAGGTDSGVTDPDGSSTSLTFAAGAGATATSRGVSVTTGASSLTITLQRPTGGLHPVTFSATWTVVTAAGTVTGTADGEALFVDGSWQLRGHSLFTGGTWNITGGEGGFSAEVSPNGVGTSVDDAVTWQIDGVVAG